MGSFKQRIAELLVTQHAATREQVETLLAQTAHNGKSFAQLLIEGGVISEVKLTELLSKELGLPMISLTKYRLDPSIVKLIPERLARRHNLIALAKYGERLTIAMADPLDIFAIDDLKALSLVAIDPVLSPETEIRRAIEQVYTAQQTFHDPASAAAADTAKDDDNIDTVVAMLLNQGQEDEAPVVRVLNLLIVEAMRRNASDIHLEPMEKALRIRYRIDGRLIEAHHLPKASQNLVLTRLKIMSGLDITEWRLPQDGRFKVRLDDREVDFRVSVLPITQGGKVVLRLLDKSNLTVGLDQLGFLPESIEAFKGAVKRPYGMILVTGPTGSGKSTTLYSILNALNIPGKHLITIEDPVEYQVEGITQVQVNGEVGVTFASGLRAILRQAPDVVMIGEIRDFETADIAMKASLTGHLVLSTLHTNDAASAVTRLVDMGVEPFLVASSVTLIEAQRLVRKLCTKCRQRFDPPQELLKRLEVQLSAGATCYKAMGCRFCHNSGYRGRMGIIEVIEVDEKIRELVVARVQSWEIKRHAMEQLGLLALRQDGLKKAEQGITTLEEVLAVTSEE